jgi:putative hydrolase of the HAD superfamily
VWEQLDLDPEEGQALMHDFWRGDRLDDALIEYIRGLKSAYQVGLITNAWPEVRRQIERQWRIDDAFHEMVISAEVGMAKPDPRIYQLMIEKLGVEANASIFIDDFEENVAAAIALGMHGIRFDHREQTIQAINRLLETQQPAG